MTKILIILFLVGTILSLIGVARSYYEMNKCDKLLDRNLEVFAFKNYLVDLSVKCDIYRAKNNLIPEVWAIDYYPEKYTYDTLLYSDKPLTLENWFTQKEIDELLLRNIKC